MPQKTDEFKELARELYRVGAVKCNEYFKLKLHQRKPQAPLSPIFLNLRTQDNPKPGPLTPAMVSQIARFFYDYVIENGIVFDFICGVPNAADPFVKEFAKLISGGEDIVLYLEKEVEAETRKIGRLKEESKKKISNCPGAIVLLVDDLITKAESKLEAIYSLEEEGLKVKEVLVFVDREQGGKEQLAAAGYKLHSISTLSGLLYLYHSEGFITDDKLQEICVYLQENS